MGLAELWGEIERLSVDEQLRLVEEVWERLLRTPEDVPVPGSHLAEVERRLVDHDADPDDVVGWEELRDAVR